MKYLKTFSSREILSALFSALIISLLFAMVLLFDLLDDYYILFSLIWLIPIALSHRFYLLEHKRRNKLIGRILHNLIIAIFIYLLLISGHYITNSFYRIGYHSNAIALVLFMVFVVETVLSVINLIFRLFKWRIW